jgi:hypothetical protein
MVVDDVEGHASTVGEIEMLLRCETELRAKQGSSQEF